MRYQVTPTNSWRVPREDKYTAEASTLGLKPGVWPMHLPTSLGNGKPFRYKARLMQGGEMISASYWQLDSNLRLEVFND